MFTGLIEAAGMVRSADTGPDGLVLAITAPIAPEVADGDSVAVNGVCLTAVRHDDAAITFEAMHETLRRTTLRGLQPGDPVNLERAVRADTRLGGHVVTGHVDGVGTVTGVQDDGFARRLTIEPPAALLALIVPQGSITVEGVSLTVADLGDRAFTVSLIPETLERTTLAAICDRGPGTPVNLEADVLAKHVAKLVAATLPAQVQAAVAAALADHGASQ